MGIAQGIWLLFRGFAARRAVLVAENLALEPRDRPTGDDHKVASPKLQAVLAVEIEEDGPAASRSRDPQRITRFGRIPIAKELSELYAGSVLTTSSS